MPAPKWTFGKRNDVLTETDFEPQGNEWLWAHFENGDQGPFNWSPELEQPQVVSEAGVDFILIPLLDSFRQPDPNATKPLLIKTTLSKVVTSCPVPLDSLERLHSDLRAEGRTRDILKSANSVAALVGILIQTRLEVMDRAVEQIDQSAGRLEAQVLDRSMTKVTARRGILLGLLEAARLRKLYCAFEIVFEALTDRHIGAFIEDVDARQLLTPLRRCQRGIGKIKQIIDVLTALENRLVLEETEQTNRILVVLTVVSAILLPASLIAGIFGMNFVPFPGWKFHTGVWLVILSSVLAGLGIAAVVVSYAKREKIDLS